MPNCRSPLAPIPVLLALATAACGVLPAQWTIANPTAAPTPRSGVAMAANAAGTVVLFGGSAPFQASNETWTYDGSSWSLLSPLGSPNPRSQLELVFDSARNRFVLFGGWANFISFGTAINETWEFDPVAQTWAQMSPTTIPVGLWKYGACFDSLRNRVVLYGGATNGFPTAQADTWEYDGSTWSQVAGANAPGPLERPAMCFHLGLARTLLFGGINPQTGGTDTTWAFDGSSWTQLPVPGSRPPVRTGGRMYYDPARGVAVLTGGMNPQTGAPFADTWEFDGASWSQPNVSHSPGRDFGLAFDPVRRKGVRFGGIAGSATNGDTYEYGASSSEFGQGCVGSNGVPQISVLNAPRLGASWTVTLTNLVPQAPFGVFVLSLGQLVPTPLAGIGMPGCIAYVTPDLLLIEPAIANGAVWNGAIPNTPSLVGTELFVQGLSLDAAANAAGLVTANAAVGRLGV